MTHRETHKLHNSETVARIQELIHHDQCQTINDNAEEVGTGYGTCQQVLMKELGMHCVTAKFVARILTADHKQQHVTQLFLVNH
jgi:6-phosphogluconate dehydrogenase